MIHNSIMADEDQGLAVSVKQGNWQSFGIAYDKYAPALLGIIKRIVNNEQLADEILQSTFVKAWQQVAAFNASKSSLFTWLINLARQTAFEAIKPAQVKNPAYSTPVYEDNNNGVYNNSHGKGQNQRSAFDLLYYMGLSCREAATELNITVEELKNMVRMKIKKLQLKK
jgi:DNA-directed RNA polymerase specialized sigma24 family protein